MTDVSDPPDLKYFDQLFCDWLEYKTGLSMRVAQARGHLYLSELRKDPSLQGKQFFSLHSSYPQDPPEEPVASADGTWPASPEVTQAMEVAAREMRALGLTANFERKLLTSTLSPWRAAMKPLFDSFPLSMTADVIAFDTDQPGFRAAMDKIWQDEGFKTFLKGRFLESHAHPFTGEPLNKQWAAQSDAEYIRVLKNQMQLWYQTAAKQGVQEQVDQRITKAFKIRYGLRPGFPVATHEDARQGDGLRGADSDMLHLLEPWIRYKTGVNINYLPDGRRNRIKSFKPHEQFYGKITLSINLSYPDMPFEGGEAAAGYRDPEPFASPEAAEKITEIGEALHSLGIPFEPLRILHDPQMQGIEMSLNGLTRSTDAPLTDRYGMIPYHSFVITPDAETLGAAADRLLADADFMQWCATQNIRFFTHPYTQKALDPEAAVAQVIGQFSRLGHSILETMEKAKRGGYQRELRQALRTPPETARQV